MNILKALKAKAEANSAKMREIAEKALAEDRDLTADEQTAYDAEKKAFDATMERIKSAQALEANEKALAEVSTTEETPSIIKSVIGGGNRQVAANPVDKLTGNEILGCAAWAVAKHKQSPIKSPHQHLEDASFGQLADHFRAATVKNVEALMQIGKAYGVDKALTTFTSGGASQTVDVPLSTDWIETLRNSSAFLSGGPVEIPLDYGGLRIPGGQNGAVGTYTLEGADSPYTQMSTRDIDLQAKHISAVTAVQDYLLETSPLALGPIVGDDLSNGMMLSIDSAGLRGDGVGANPAGILSLVDASHKFAATANTINPTYLAIDADLRKIETAAIVSNIPARRRAWRMSGRTFVYMKYLRDGNGNYIWPSLHLASPTLLNYPIVVSEQIPSNLGVGTNESEIYMIDFGYILMGVARSLRLKASQEASYKDSGGTLVSAFSREQTVIRASGSHDFDMRYSKAAVVLTGVKWGAAA